MADGNILAQVFLPLSLAFIMVSVGLELSWDDFRRVALQPRDFLVGAISQVLLLPAVAFGLLTIWPIAPELAVGIMIIAACPGGVTSNLLTYLARGDPALSVSLTAVIRVATVLTLPLLVGLSMVHFMGVDAGSLDVTGTVLGVFAITTIPVVIGMVIRWRAPSFASRAEPPARMVATVLFILIVAGAIFQERANILGYFQQAGPIALALNLIMMALAAGLAAAAGLGRRQRVAVTLECGLQNGTLAIFVAATLIGNATMMVPGGIYSLLMFPTAILYVVLFRARRR